MNASLHAKQRMKERAPGIDLERLWNAGRPATIADVEGFCTLIQPGMEYRICVSRGARYLVVWNPVTANVVTVIRR